jgi:hypothetical protein
MKLIPFFSVWLGVSSQRASGTSVEKTEISLSLKKLRMNSSHVIKYID